MGFAHFRDAQDPVWHLVLAELEAGRKTSHWMWFVFPQIAGLGQSEMSRRYALDGLVAAKAYLDDDVLGSRLETATRTILFHAGKKSVHDIFGSPDDLKFHSSMTLFARAAPSGSCFALSLAKFFGGFEDAATLARL